MAEETKVEEVKKENVAENTDEIRSMDDISSEIDASFENFRDADAEGWDKCKTYMEEGTVLDLTVDGIATKGGVIVNIEGIRGFVPASHLSLSV